MEKRTERQTRTREAAFETRENGDEKRIEGYFSVFGSDYEIFPGATESIDPHAFDDALTQDNVRVLVDHDTRLVLGRTSAGTAELRVDDHGLWGSVIINPDDTDAMNAYARNKRGDVTHASFGFDILDEETEYKADGSVHVPRVQGNGAEGQGRGSEGDPEAEAGGPEDGSAGAPAGGRQNKMTSSVRLAPATFPRGEGFNGEANHRTVP